MTRLAFAAAVAAAALATTDGAHANQSAYQGMAAAHAAANGVPLSLVHRVIMRESRYNARAVSKGNYGIMQIRLGTARAMGLHRQRRRLLDPNTNMTYAGEISRRRVSRRGRNESRAVSLYASGYYYAAKRQGINAYTQRASYRQPVETANYSPFVPQQPQRVSYRRQTRNTETAVSYWNPFAWQQPQQTATRRSARAQRVASSTTYTWQNPFASLFTPAKPQRVTRHSTHRTRYVRSNPYAFYSYY